MVTEHKTHVTNKFSKEEKMFIEKLFQAFDTDRSGKIDFLEFKILARKLGVEMSDDELRKSMEAVDTDGNMELDIYEFLMWLEGAQAEGADPFSMLKAKIKAQGLKPLNNSQIEGLRECFNHFDSDGSGAIDVHELGNVFHAFGQELSDDELQQMIKDVDVDDSGEIEFEEFLMLMIHNFGSDESAEQEVQNEFQKHDPENTGVLSTMQLKEIIGELCGEFLPFDEINEIVASADENNTGRVEYMKWESLWEALR
eukprot:gene6173-9451_t